MMKFRNSPIVNRTVFCCTIGKVAGTVEGCVPQIFVLTVSERTNGRV